MRFRPANIRLINRRSLLPRLLLALSSRKDKNNCKDNHTEFAALTRSLHIRAMHSSIVLAKIHLRNRASLLMCGSLSSLSEQSRKIVQSWWR